MADNRLIDVNEAKRRIIAFATGCHTTYLEVSNIVMMLNQAPTVDAVLVVRCKDCKHSYEGVASRLMCGRCGRIINGIRVGGNAVREDHFCSYGERKK